MADKRKKVVLCTRLFDAGVEYLNDRVDLVWHVNEQPQDIVADLTDADAIVLGLQKLDATTMKHCLNLKVIARQGVGFDNIDATAATSLGIPIVITPGANSRSVAEHTMCCILATFKNLRREINFASAGDFSHRNNCEAYELYGKTVGIIGLGKIGQYVAEMCKAFSMNIMAYDPFLSQTHIEEGGYIYASSVDDILKCSDVITIHVPLTEATINMISYREFNLMKPTACLINCSRGKIVDEDALYYTLKDRKIWGAAIDAFEREPTQPDNPLLTLDNFIPTPHVAALTKEASKNMGTMVGEGIWSVLNGHKYPYVGNPLVYQHEKWI